jgi:hypothetical protein
MSLPVAQCFWSKRRSKGIVAIATTANSMTQRRRINPAPDIKKINPRLLKLKNPAGTT